MSDMSKVLIEERDSSNMSGNTDTLFSKTSKVGVLTIRRLFLSHVRDLARASNTRDSSLPSNKTANFIQSTGSIGEVDC